MFGHMKAFHWPMKERIAIVAIAFLFIGMTTFQRNLKSGQQSTFADLKSAGGICVKYSRSMKM